VTLQYDLEVRGHCMCKEMPVILVNKVVDPKKNNWKNWRAEEEELDKGSLTPPPPPQKKIFRYNRCLIVSSICYELLFRFLSEHPSDRCQSDQCHRTGIDSIKRSKKCRVISESRFELYIFKWSVFRKRSVFFVIRKLRYSDLSIWKHLIRLLGTYEVFPFFVYFSIFRQINIIIQIFFCGQCLYFSF
jgi:hypothetical protein